MNIINTLPKHPTKRYGKRRLDQIKYIVIHHFAGDITVKEAAEYHVSKGWPGIGYTFVIDGGEIYVTNYLDTVSYAVKGNNTACLSIAIRGNYEDKLPSPNSLYSLEDTIYDIRQLLGDLPVKVHSDFVNTKCPGDKLRRWVRSMYPD